MNNLVIPQGYKAPLPNYELQRAIAFIKESFQTNLSNALNLRRVSALCGLDKYRSRLLFSAGEKPYLSLRLKKGDDVLKLTNLVLTDFAAAPQ